MIKPIFPIKSISGKISHNSSTIFRTRNGSTHTYQLLHPYNGPRTTAQLQCNSAFKLAVYETNNILSNPIRKQLWTINYQKHLSSTPANKHYNTLRGFIIASLTKYYKQIAIKENNVSPLITIHKSMKKFSSSPAILNFKHNPLLQRLQLILLIILLSLHLSSANYNGLAFLPNENTTSKVSLTKIGNPKDLTFQTSTDGINWTDYTMGEEMSVYNFTMFGIQAYQYVLFRVKEPTSEFSLENKNSYRFIIDKKVSPVNLAGNIMYLLSPDGNGTSVPPNAFFELFAYTNIKHVADSLLPAKTVSTNSYFSMFFQSEIESAPELPATTLGDYSYTGMFGWCTQLKKGPSKLPATTLADYCYLGMFANCPSMVIGPDTLPAKVLKTECYSDMFLGCNNLAVAPVILAETLAYQSCYLMFNGCPIKELKVAFKSWYPSDATGQWLSDVPGNGTFYAPCELITESRNSSTVPSSWTIDKSYHNSLFDTIPYGDSILWNSIYYKETDSYTDTLTSTLGCDSILTLHLTVLPKPHSPHYDTLYHTLYDTLCNGDSLLWNGTYYSSTDTFTHTFHLSDTLDSIVTLHLTILSTYHDTISDTLYWGETFHCADTFYTTPGHCSVTFPSSLGCDSILTYNISFIDSPNVSAITSPSQSTIRIYPTWVHPNQTVHIYVPNDIISFASSSLYKSYNIPVNESEIGVLHVYSVMGKLLTTLPLCIGNNICHAPSIIGSYYIKIHLHASSSNKRLSRQAYRLQVLP